MKDFSPSEKAFFILGSLAYELIHHRGKTELKKDLEDLDKNRNDINEFIGLVPTIKAHIYKIEELDKYFPIVAKLLVSERWIEEKDPLDLYFAFVLGYMPIVDIQYVFPELFEEFEV